VLEDVSIAVGGGQTVALLGTNGNGKSTLMKCVMGLLRPTEGSITAEIDGKSHDLTRMSTEEIVELGIAMVPEGRRLFPKLTVEENLYLGAFRRVARESRERNLKHSFEAFPVLQERRRQLAGSLSGGEQQMLTVARTLMGNPRILLLDEPSEGLAPVIVQTLGQQIAALRREGLTILLSEQNLKFAARLADRAYIIEKGQIRWEGPMGRLLEDEATRRAYLTV